MIIYVTTDSEGYVNGLSTRPMTAGADAGAEGGPLLPEFSFDVPDDHGVFEIMESWKVEEGALIQPEGRVEELEEIVASIPEPMTAAEMAKELKELRSRVQLSESTTAGLMGLMMRGGPK